jgi:hypothetical protein
MEHNGTTSSSSYFDLVTQNTSFKNAEAGKKGRILDLEAYFIMKYVRLN